MIYVIFALLFSILILLGMIITREITMAATLQDLQAAIAQETQDLQALSTKVDLLQPNPQQDFTNEVAAIAANDQKVKDMTTKVTAITG